MTPKPRPEAAFPPAILAEGVCVDRGGVEVLRGLSVRLERGETAALVGANGSGKTTFGRVLTGHAFVRSGRLAVLGETLGRTDVRALRRRVGVIHPDLSSGDAHTPGAVVDRDLPAIDAVCTGFFGTVGRYDVPTPAQRGAAEERLVAVGLAGRLGHRVGTLSTGELRRLLLARLLVMEPGLLVLDEPTAGLDPGGRAAFLATLTRLHEGPEPPAVVLITHHVEELPPHTHAAWLLESGRLSGAGPPAAVLTGENLTRAFGLRVRVRHAGGGFSLQAGAADTGPGSR
ncbi:ABC transporter ATP-binding protein [Phycisphaera mikurensis]|uniref:Putative ABC transporter ATP-binding protein n=1 Tax=Phycisphaera mikurensis (strain NBRC 102666 / KCTC 22515 / FYK2301M01) TaxID=1142394 RepID=I0IBA6_PHYMF|nr:ATP-binding cassette domain-containing protein [Phycisphaera mikurensis]MBB6443039.1 iron complex transport system ATP-binding protein [Phycisphaera mikurensis]BAM02544.1 putative ABC transporter ATP-binding protein [Phycisphaera mikurensis NBRC 102666]